MKVGLAQISPVLLDHQATRQKMREYCLRAAKEGCELIVFPEALLPGYPFWIEHTEGAKFESDLQKTYFHLYWQAAADVASLWDFQEIARENSLAMYLGMIEKSQERGHSLYCSLVYIDKHGEIGSVHRKLQPTYEERLVWSPGDGHGLKVHRIGDFVVGGLNCWENWMPMARMALYGQGENVHVSVWPGNAHNTEPMMRFIAREARSYAIGVGGVLRPQDIPADFPQRDRIASKGMIANGGSCVASPEGKWVLPPQSGTEELYIVDLSLEEIVRERHNFDVAGHYGRPDILKLTINEERQRTVD